MGLRTSSPPGDLLAIYLNDHRAGSDGGRGLARRCQSANRGTPLGDYLIEFLDELDQDAELVERLCDSFEVRNDWPKRWAVRIGHHLGALKMNGQLLGYSPLSRVLELEALIAAVNAKGQLWATLLDDELRARIAAADADDIAAAERRAEGQAERLADHHRLAVREAFVDPGEPGRPQPTTTPTDR